MKFFVVFAAITIASVLGEDVYDTSKFGNVDIDAILQNDRLLQNHFNCLIDGKGCTPEGEELRKHIPEIMETCCAKCSDKQKEDGKKVTEFLLQNKPEIMKKLLDKYDPERKYKEKCADHLKSQGIDLSGF
ncbi:ejaculatory bulb-specific protein 3-like [Coccinella septempunctata]|uniref:ejaculatory bulb-specific protein 3-like n=1 Tax=Coccinella septempunctata TaxID=41139 RepID=UPI001D0703B7|nr:ejaculatory bulb-specific protein 3-like [Coccinella septempunctata]